MLIEYFGIPVNGGPKFNYHVEGYCPVCRGGSFRGKVRVRVFYGLFRAVRDISAPPIGRHHLGADRFGAGTFRHWRFGAAMKGDRH